MTDNTPVDDALESFLRNTRNHELIELIYAFTANEPLLHGAYRREVLATAEPAMREKIYEHLCESRQELLRAVNLLKHLEAQERAND